MEDISNAYSMLYDVVSKMDDQSFDHFFWNEIKEEKDIDIFDNHINLIEESQHWDKKLNHKKGAVLEDFSLFLFNRFVDVKVQKNKRPGDNETDIETTLGEKPKPTFMIQTIGPKIVCECKNVKSKSIDVGMISKLAEILPIRGSKFGIFISILGIGGSGWRFGEGKRKKIMYKDRLPIISFTINELKELRNGANFYTMIRCKYWALLDEVDDDSADIPDSAHREYHERLFSFINHIKMTELVDEKEYQSIINRIEKRYGIEFQS